MPRSCRDCLPMMPTELSAVLPARHIQEECGVFGVYAPETTDVAPLAYYALYALQHRGQESAGIAVNDDGVFTAYRDVGLVNEVFPAERLRSLGTGTIAVGHVRYGTTGSDNKRNVQPILVNHYKGRMALAHNGNLTNSHQLRQELESRGSIFQTTTDSEVIAYINAGGHNEGRPYYMEVLPSNNPSIYYTEHMAVINGEMTPEETTIAENRGSSQAILDYLKDPQNVTEKTLGGWHFYESRIIGLGASIEALEKNGNAEWITPKYPPTTPTSEQKKATLDKTELQAYEDAGVQDSYDQLNALLAGGMVPGQAAIPRPGSVPPLPGWRCTAGSFRAWRRRGCL